MSDPNTPDGSQPNTPPSPAPAPTGSAYPSAPAPGAYGSAPPPPGQPSASVPGKTLGIVAFVLSFFVQLVALILGIVAMVQSRKAGVKNGWALAAIIISAVLLVVGVIVLVAVFGFAAAGLVEMCSELGPGTHVLEGGGTVTCG